MKTKVNFNIESEEITKQLGDIISAEVKNDLRKVAEKAMQDALNEKFKSLINSLDYVTQHSWSEGYHFNQYIKEAIKEVVRDALKNHSATLDEEIKRHAQQCVKEYQLNIAEMNMTLLNMVQREVQKQVSEVVQNVVQNKIIENLFKNN